LAERELTIELKNPQLLILLVFLSAIFIMELQVSLESPIAFGDEGYHTRMAEWMGEELEYPVWTPFRLTPMTKFAFSRQPLWSLLEGGFIMIFGFTEVIVKILTPFIAFVTGLSTYLIIKEIYNKRVGFLASIISVTIPSFVTYSVLFYTDVLEAFYLSMFFLLFILGMKRNKQSYLILASMLSGLAYLTKKTGIVSVGFIALVFLYELLKHKKPKLAIKKYLPLLLIPGLIFLAHAARTFYFYGAPCDVPVLDEIFPTSGRCGIFEFESQYEYAGRVAEVGTEQTIINMGILSYLEFAYGNIWLVIFGASMGCFLLVKKGRSRDIFVLLAMLTYVLVLAQSIGRAEDAARFAIPWVPILALMAAMAFDEWYKFIRSYQKHIAVIIFIVVIFASYQNFASKIGVMAQVKQFYPSYFEACDWVKENTPEDAIISTLWVHRASYCTQRVVTTLNVDMTQSNDVDYILDVAQQFGITHIWINKFSIDIQNQHLSEMIDLSYVQLLEDNSDHFKKIYETGPAMTECTQQLCDGNIVYEVVY
jgi:4-amino-4-deoxy-L-arabinose transferase-like glycosyltransferase